MVYDDKLAAAAYVIGCQRTGEAIVIDPQRDVDRYEALAAANGLRIVAVAETHIHADFVSGARELAEKGATDSPHNRVTMQPTILTEVGPRRSVRPRGIARPAL
jgi:glyoxylase-like metal-dependent hydrolase (beta-lactamase superfamily II)